MIERFEKFGFRDFGHREKQGDSARIGGKILDDSRRDAKGECG